MAYHIPGWQKHFENAESKRLKRTTWVPIPSAQASLGMSRLMQDIAGPTYYGVWIMIVRMASQCPVRGVLITDSGHELTAEDMALMNNCASEFFEDAIPKLMEIGWLEEFPQAHPGMPEDSQHEGKGREQNGMEQKGREGNATPPPLDQLKLILKKNHFAAYSTEAVQEWATELADVGGVRTMDEAQHMLYWIRQRCKKEGLQIKYAREAMSLLKEYKVSLDHHRMKEAESE